jgi:membrane protease YdiL (CAAX protease family)
MAPWVRAGRVAWRLVAFAVAFVLLQGIAEAVLGPVGRWVTRAMGTPVPLYPWTTLGGAVGATVVLWRVVDQRPWSAVGLGPGAWAPRALGWGAAVGAAAIGATALGLGMVGALRFEPMPAASAGAWGGAALRVLLVLAPAALWEEVVFRGVLYEVADEAGGARVARWSTSVAFGLVHAANPGAGVRTLAAVMLAGWLLARVREHTGSLPAAWCAHLAWNWIMAAGLHVPVSGLPFDTPGYRAVLEGPAWLTGGSWGPEGGGVALGVMGAGAWRARPRQRRVHSTARAGGS